MPYYTEKKWQETTERIEELVRRYGNIKTWTVRELAKTVGMSTDQARYWLKNGRNQVLEQQGFYKDWAPVAGLESDEDFIKRFYPKNMQHRVREVLSNPEDLRIAVQEAEQELEKITLKLKELERDLNKQREHCVFLRRKNKQAITDMTRRWSGPDSSDP
ncbi:MAG: hypothetical protein ACREOB_07770 [Thermodesulfobacteriota bacterium]